MIETLQDQEKTMHIDEITRAAQERLAALDAEAKPHEDALATINAERERLRLIVSAGKGERLYPVAPPRSILEGVYIGPPGQPVPFPQWQEPWSPNIPCAGTAIVCGVPGFVTS